MKRQWALLLATTAVTVALAIGIIRFFAPGLLGVPTDLQLVQVSKKVPPFFDGVFRADDLESQELLVQDPIVIMRGRPLFENALSMGPHDVLGFRNRSVPYTADIVTIGDSQTYGNNVPVEENWPSRLKAHLPAPTPIVYNMSCGAWSGPHYLEIMEKALHLRPRVVVVAFYSGNDPVAAFTSVFGSDRWKALRISSQLSKSDAPKINFPAPQAEQWPVRFRDGTATVFTPHLRYGSNLPDYPAIQEGWRILLETAKLMTEMARKAGVATVFTVIPTKELVLAPRISAEGIDSPAVYRELVEAESSFIQRFARDVEAIPDAFFVDTVEPLQSSALTEVLYPSTINGHPVASGYDVIARAIAPALTPLLPELTPGLAFLNGGSERTVPTLITRGGYYLFSSPQMLRANGWASQASFNVVTERDLATVEYLGSISEVDQDRYGPGAIGR